MFSNTALIVKDICKYYEIYESPVDRLKQSLWRGRRTYYRSFKALDGISFEINKGETLGIIGKNGAGKSTLLQLICGTLTPTSGEISVNGRVAALLELGSGFNPEFTGRENVIMSATILGLTKAEIENRLEEIIAFADIGDFIDQPVKTYSSGMYVRLAFSVIAHVDADILVIDEALAVGDAYFTQKCMRFLRAFKETGTLLFVSHDITSVVNFCDSAIWIDNGVVKKKGTAKDVTELYMEDMHNISAKDAAINDLKIPQEKNIKDNKLVCEKYWDQRLKYINNSNLRNDLQIFKFDEQGPSFGQGGIKIVNVTLHDEVDKPLIWVVGGELVSLYINCIALIDVDMPIVGFYVKDRMGQTLFGENTYLTYESIPKKVDAGTSFSTKFTFYLPILPAGEYSICVAVAEGTQESHIMHQWMHDALILTSKSSSVATGLVGIPMSNISIELN